MIDETRICRSILDFAVLCATRTPCHAKVHERSVCQLGLVERSHSQTSQSCVDRKNESFTQHVHSPALAPVPYSPHNPRMHAPHCAALVLK